MAKIINDKYYTPKELAQKLIEVTFKILLENGISNISDIIEPSAGNGSLGKVPEYVGQYAQEAYFYCHKPEYMEQMKQLLEFNTIRKYVQSISAKRISVMRLYKYLKDNIKGVE